MAVLALALVVAAAVGVGLSLSGPSRSVRPRRSTGGTPIDPAYFADGACVSYPPTAGDRHTVVFLDAGHGGVDPGAVGTTEAGQSITEASLTLPVALDTMALLRARGYTVVLSRTTDSTVLRLGPGDESGGDLTLLGSHDDEAARDVCADRAHADILIGIYFDAGSSPSNAGSVTGYDPDRPFAADNLRLATLVQDDVLGDLNARGWGIPDEGVQSDDALGSVAPTDSDTGLADEAQNYDHLLLLGPASPGYFSTPSLMPGVVIEPLFITDPFEADIADSALGQHVIALGLAQAVDQYFGPPRTKRRAAAS
ncbi:MAG: N-acetylmuramoyl-L-alanine amidase family protein [Acidimicrobiales bacterium]